MIKPERLRAGDRVAVVSPSWGGPGTFPQRYAAGVAQLRAEFGLEAVAMPHALRDAGWLARNPQARAEDLMAAFADPSLKGIIASIGGDDSLRILRHLDLGVIRANPKVFLGFSDTTMSHLACFKAGLVSFYGPTIMAGFAENGGMFPYMIAAVRRTLFETAPIGLVPPNRAGWTVEHLDWGDPSLQTRRRELQPSTGWRWLQGSGARSGRLLGGCLEVLDWARGTPFWPEPAAWDGAILFIETSEEAPPPQAVVRSLRSYAAQGILGRLAALLVGRPGGGVPASEFPAYDAAVLQVVATEEGLTDLPVVAGMDFGHTDPMLVLPYGLLAQVDCERQEFAILESAVA
jgi:muramoyltetrapeptide carboxypeptidase LdcA involved in peptidoglycan recycling